MDLVMDHLVWGFGLPFTLARWGEGTNGGGTNIPTSSERGIMMTMGKIAILCAWLAC